MLPEPGFELQYLCGGGATFLAGWMKTTEVCQENGNLAEEGAS